MSGDRMSKGKLVPPFADIAVLGLGAMGSAVANRFIATGLRVAVWNRSPEKMTPLVTLGADGFNSSADALCAAPITVVILTDTKTACDVLRASRASLTGRTIVNFCSGTTADSYAFRVLVENAGGKFLQGSITAYPRNIGHPDSCFFYSGDLEAFNTNRAILDHLSGGSLFLPEADASALGAAITIQAFVAMGGFYEAIAAGTKIGGDVGSLTKNLARVSRFLFLDAIDDAADRISNSNFSGEQATVDIHIAHIESLMTSLSKHEIQTPLLDAFLVAAKRAKMLGFGSEDIAAINKALAL